jgi:hypothetical protein
MGFMTLENFRDDLESAMGDRGIGELRLARWVNFGYIDISGAIEFEMLETTSQFTTSNGNRSIPVPSNVMIVKGVRDRSNDRLLGWIQKNEYFRRSSLSTGQPTQWSRHGNEILLYPVPDGGYSIDVMYQTFPTLLINDSDTTILPNMWDVAVHQLSVYYGLQTVGEEQRASLWYNRAVNYIQSRMTEDIHRATTAGLSLANPPIQQLDVRPFIGQAGAPTREG